MTAPIIADAWNGIEPTVRGYLQRRLRGDDATVDDLVQEVFLRMRMHADDLRSAERVGPWATRIARSALIDHLRRRRPAVPLSDGFLPAPAMDDDPFDATGLATCAHAQIASLPLHEAAAIRLVDLACMPPAQAARQLGIGLSALKARLRRGRQRLRLALDRCCHVPLDGQGRPAGCEPRPQTLTCASCT